MTVVVLGASGGVGRQLVRQALARREHVRALVRDPERAAFAADPRLEVVRTDVHDADSVRAAIGAGDVVLSGLGTANRSGAGTLGIGARLAVSAAPRRIVWLGASGTDASSAAVRAPMRALLRRMFGPEWGDKNAADSAVLAAGGIVLHTGPMSDGDDDPAIGLVSIGEVRRRLMPAGAPRASIARLMLDLALDPLPRRGLVVVAKP